MLPTSTLPTSTLKERIVVAALRLAGERPWGQVTVRDIAEAAGTDLNGLRGEFPSKPAILSAFIRMIDEQVLSRVQKFSADEAARDRVFDVLMTRFDTLQPYKAALRSIRSAQPFDLDLARRVMASQAWMLHAAGVGTDGLIGFSRVAGLGTVYASVLDTWLEDDDPGHARTMAALDRRLKRAEQAAQTVDDVMDGIGRAAGRLRDMMARTEKRATSATAPTPPPAPSTEPPSAPVV